MNHIFSMLLAVSLATSGHVAAETISNTSNPAVPAANACILDSRGLYRSMTPAGYVMPVIPLEAALAADSRCPQVSDVEKLKAAYKEYDHEMLVCGQKLNVYLNALPKQSLSNMRATISPHTSGILDHAIQLQKETGMLLDDVRPCISDQKTSFGSCTELFNQIQNAQTQKGLDFHNSPSGQYMWKQLQLSLWNSAHRSFGSHLDPTIYQKDELSEVRRKREEAHQRQSLVMANQDIEQPVQGMRTTRDEQIAIQGFLNLCLAH